jgi:hypothetical protein
MSMFYSVEALHVQACDAVCGRILRIRIAGRVHQFLEPSNIVVPDRHWRTQSIIRQLELEIKVLPQNTLGKLSNHSQYYDAGDRDGQ